MSVSPYHQLNWGLLKISICVSLRDEKLYPVIFIYVFNFELVEHFFLCFGLICISFFLFFVNSLFTKKIVFCYGFAQALGIEETVSV